MNPSNPTPEPRTWHRYASAKYFFAWLQRWLPWLGAGTGLLLLVGLDWGLLVAPEDYQQGQSVRIIYVHVPAAWISMLGYMSMAGASVVFLVWRIKLADAFAASAAPVGAWFTLVALASGSLWGKPMWGTWWVWDARLTSELLLLFLYLGIMALRSSIDEPQRAARAAALLSIVGTVNIPIIHYSVVWWNTLHQPATVSKFGRPSMDTSMLWPLLVCAVAFTLYFFLATLLRMRVRILAQEAESRWLQKLHEAPQGRVTVHRRGERGDA